jgi:hypothetical protein
LFQKFKSFFFKNEKSCNTFKKICHLSCPFILKKNTWSRFENYLSLWESESNFMVSFLSLMYTSITYKISLDRFIQVLEKCYKYVHFKTFISRVFYEKVIHYLNPKPCRQVYAQLLLMYGAEISPQLRLLPWELDWCKEHYPKLRNIAFSILFLYCFQKKNVQLIFF